MGEFWTGTWYFDRERGIRLTSQGAPETGDIPNAMKKPTSIPVSHASLEYAPTAGTKVPNHLREGRVTGRNFVLPWHIFIIPFTVRAKKVSIRMRLDPCSRWKLMVECLYCSWRESGIESFGRRSRCWAEVRLLWLIIVILLTLSLIILVTPSV